MKYAGPLLAAAFLLPSCARTLLRTEPAFDGRPASEWRTLAVKYSYTDSTCAVLRLTPRVQLHSVQATRNVYKRSWWLGDESFARNGCTPASWIGGCLAGPLLYLVTGYLDFFALSAIGPAVTVLIRTRLVFPMETKHDTIASRPETPSYVTVAVAGITQRAQRIEVRDGEADVYLNDFYDVAQSDSGIVLEVTATTTNGKADIRVPRDDLARARKSGRTYWTDMRAAAVLEAVNAVEVPPFAYPSSSYEHPNPANVSVFADSEAGETLLVVRLRQDADRVLACATGLANGGFLGRFDYMCNHEPGWRAGGSCWRGTGFGHVMWDTVRALGIEPKPGKAFREVGFLPSRIIIEVYAVEDSVWSWSQLGADRVREARLQAERVGFNGVDIEFYWMLQQAQVTPVANRSKLVWLLEGGPIGSGGKMRILTPDEVLFLEDLSIPQESPRPKSMRLMQRWTLDRRMRTTVSVGKYGEWTEEQVKSAAKIEQFGGQE